MIFKTNPNFRFRTLASGDSESLGGSCNFEVLQKNQKTYLISPFFQQGVIANRYFIRIINLEDNKVIKQLDGHEDRILNVRYFLNENNKKGYLISSDRKSKVIVWDVDNDYKLLKKLNMGFSAFIYSSAIVFKNNSIYAISSSIENNNSAKIADITNNEEPKEIPSTRDIAVYFLAPWFDKNSSKNYLILCGNGKIRVVELLCFNRSSFSRDFSTGNDQQYNLGGLVYNYNKKDYFMSTSNHGGVLIIDLKNMQLVGDIIKFDKCNFYNPVKWNEKYMLILDSYNKTINVIDLLYKKLVSKMVFLELEGVRYMKKVIHPIYGEALLIIGVDYKINLLTSRSINKFKD